MNTKTKAAAAVMVAMVLWLGYYLGHRNGVQQERRAWLATEQTVSAQQAPVTANGRDLQRPRNYAGRTYYSNPHTGQTFIASSGSPPVNRPDLRDTPAR